MVGRESTDEVVWKRVNIPSWQKESRQEPARRTNGETDRERIERASGRVQRGQRSVGKLQ